MSACYFSIRTNEGTVIFEKYILIEGSLHIILCKSVEMQRVFLLHSYNTLRELYVHELR